jgi:hypothetical protein
LRAKGVRGGGRRKRGHTCKKNLIINLSTREERRKIAILKKPRPKIHKQGN